MFFMIYYRFIETSFQVLCLFSWYHTQTVVVSVDTPKVYLGHTCTGLSTSRQNPKIRYRSRVPGGRSVSYSGVGWGRGTRRGQQRDRSTHGPNVPRPLQTLPPVSGEPWTGLSQTTPSAAVGRTSPSEIISKVGEGRREARIHVTQGDFVGQLSVL